MSQGKWNYNGLELEADFEDVDFLEKYSKAMYKLSDNSKNLPKDGKDIDRIKDICKCYQKFFDDVFDPDTSLALFGSKQNLRLYEEAFISLVNLNEKVNEQMNVRRMSLQPKNRAQHHKSFINND